MIMPIIARIIIIFRIKVHKGLRLKGNTTRNAYATFKDNISGRRSNKFLNQFVWRR